MKPSEQAELLISTLDIMHDMHDEWRMFPKKVAALEAANADLMNALEVVNDWFEEDEDPVPFWPNESEAQIAYEIATVVRNAIRKHKGEVK